MARKEKVCKNHVRGRCSFGEKCRFSHDIQSSATPQDSLPNKNIENVKRICRDFGTPQGCGKGTECSFRHVKPGAESGMPQTQSSEAAKKYINAPMANALFRKYRKFLPRYSASDEIAPLEISDLSTFLSLACQIVTGEDPSLRHQVIKELADEAGLHRIKELVEALESGTVGRSSRRIAEDFVLPFTTSITHRSVISSMVLETAVGTIYNVLFGVNGRRGVAFFETSVDTLVMVLAEQTLPQKVLSSLISSVSTALAKLLETNQRAAIMDEFQSIAKKLEKCMPSSDDSKEPLDSSMQTAIRHFRQVKQRLGLAANIPKMEKEIPTKASMVKVVFKTRQQGPGALASDGPRHDNDHEDIGKIKILPTALEISSQRRAYLPTRDPADWHIENEAGLLDRHFRLLREDAVGPLRDSVRSVISRLQSFDSTTTFRTGSGARVFVYTKVVLSDLVFNEKTGLMFRLEFDQPSQVKDLTTRKRWEWWTETKQLQIDSLVCLVDSEGNTQYFVVSHRPLPAKAPGEVSTALPKLAKNLCENPLRGVIQLQLIDTEGSSGVQALDRYRYQQGLSQVLVEFPGVLLPSFRPTLMALQDIANDSSLLPFSDLLCPAMVQESTKFPLLANVPAPQYSLQQGFRWDLKSITKDVPLFLSPREKFDTDDLVRATTLDESQSRALISGLTRSLALIQGPPGTGKSYCAVQMVKVMLDNRKRADIGPIICVYYTNHALDQFLEHLINDGESDIIRLGSRSKSELLQGLNLRVATESMEQTNLERQTVGQLMHRREDLSKKIVKQIAAMKSANSAAGLRAYLAEKYPDHYKELFEADEEGFTKVHAHKDDPFSQWLHDPWAPMQLTLVEERSDHELHRSKLTELNRPERQRLYNLWISLCFSDAKEDLLLSLEEHDTIKTELQNTRQEKDLRCLQTTKIIGVTTSGLARNLNLLRRLNSKVLVCEEAGEVLEAHVLTALLPSIEHAILIGDHEQLKPQIQNYDLSSENTRGKQFSLDISLFERLVRPSESNTLAIPFSTLSTQRRMDPSISKLVRQTIYPHLSDHDSVTGYPSISGIRRRLFWLDHRQAETGTDNASNLQTSHSNEYEVELTAALVSHLVRQGVYKNGEIAVITPYVRQLQLIRRRLSQAFEIVLGDLDTDDLEKLEIQEGENTSATPAKVSSKARVTSVSAAVRCATVDNFQGEEAKVVIISLVRSNLSNKCGFLRTSNRINVLLSRAKHGMYIIGNNVTSRHVAMWNTVIDIFEQSGNIGRSLPLCCPRHPTTPIDVTKPDDFALKSPEGGCSLKCGLRLDCGHTCTFKCHSQLLHDMAICQAPCPRSRDNCDHPCPRLCGEKCPVTCSFPVKNISLKCGHIAQLLSCHKSQNLDLVKCDVKVLKLVPGCGDLVEVECKVDVASENFQCPGLCNEILSCGHMCTRNCSECKQRKESKVTKTEHGKCTTVCGRPFSTCGHHCTKNCHDGTDCGLCTKSCEIRCAHSKCSRLCTEPCAPCAEPCIWECPHRGKCQLPCAVPCDRLPCDRRCEKKLDCGHQCPTVCGELCPSSSLCQICASPGIKGLNVDYLEGHTYEEVNLDETPCVIPGCSHIMTLESMDGHMGMADHYFLSENNKVMGTKKPSMPFSELAVKSCPICRRPILSIERYNRITKRALLDEATKKYIIWANATFVELEGTTAEQEQILVENSATLQKFSAGEPQPGEPIPFMSLNGTPESQIDFIRSLPIQKRYSQLIKLRHQISEFLQQVKEIEQPFGKVQQIANDSRRRFGISSDFAYDDDKLQFRNPLLATALQLRLDYSILSDFFNVYQNGRTQKSSPAWMHSEARLDFFRNRQQCSKLVYEAALKQQPMLEVEGRLLLVKFIILERSAPNNEDIVEDLVKIANEQLEKARLMCTTVPSITALKSDVEETARLLESSGFYTTVTNEEKRAIYAAMAREFRGTGHWYYCENGHPFTVGECGMPMETSTCPQCGATVGGLSHQPVDGVELATDLEDQFSGLALH